VNSLKFIFLFANTFFIVWASSGPLLGPRSWGRCWADIRLSRQPDLSGHALHESVDGLDIEEQQGQRSVLLLHTHKPFTEPFPCCVSSSGNVRHRCRGG